MLQIADELITDPTAAAERHLAKPALQPDLSQDLAGVHGVPPGHEITSCRSSTPWRKTSVTPGMGRSSRSGSTVLVRSHDSAMTDAVTSDMAYHRSVMSKGTLEPKRLGARLRRLREGRGLTLKQVHDLTGISISYLSDLELGKALPSIDVALRLARLYRITVEELASVGPESPVTEEGEQRERDDVTTIAAHENPPPPGFDPDEWAQMARKKLEEVIAELKQEWEEEQRKHRKSRS